MAKRKTNRPTQAERAVRILEYLKHHTDEEHPILLSEMREDPMISEDLGATETLNDMICGIAKALNSGPDEASLPEEQWRLRFDGYKTLLEGGDEEETPKARVRIRNLHYRHPFSQEEVDRLVEAVLFSETLGQGEADELARKIREHLASKHYTWRYNGISRVRSPQQIGEKRARENIPTLQKAIEEKKKVCFSFNGYNRQGRLVPVEEPYIATPYYIAANSGRYYLIGSPDGKRGEPPTGLFLWRVDLMTGLTVMRKGRNSRGVPIRQVEALRELWNGWDENFFTRHLNMSYDQPVTVRMKIKANEGRPGYTFLYDWFGDSFRRVGEDQVEVECSHFGMLHWALQYSDRVEVLSPPELREDIRKEVQKLKEKYLGERE